MGSDSFGKIGISVLIVNYNGEKFLKDSINSISECLSQSTIKFEILVLDNNSTDNSIIILKELAEMHNGIVVRIYESNCNLGFAKGNNILAEKAKFKYLFLLNNDTKTIELKNLLSILNNNHLGNDTVLSCEIFNPDLSPQQNVFTFPSILKLFLEMFLLKSILKKLIPVKKIDHKNLVNNYFSGCFIVLTKELYMKYQGFDERFFFYHEEGDLFLRMGKNIKKILTNDKIIHFGGRGNQVSSFAFVNYYVGLYKLYFFNKIVSGNILWLIFKVGTYFRILLLKMRIKINYLPLKIYNKQPDTRTKREIINLHIEVLTAIRKIT